MKIQNTPIDELKPYGNNPRINSKAIDKVKESLELYGWQQPIVVDKDMVIIAGHTRFQAAKKLELPTVPVLIADDLTPEQAQAYRIMDNKSAEFAKWDEELLATELGEMFNFNEEDLSLTSLQSGFSELEIDRLLNGDTYNANKLEERKTRDTEIVGRVAIVMSNYQYKNRGIGTYVNTWIEWGILNNYQIDLITDSSDINTNQFEKYSDLVNVISADDNTLKQEYRDNNITFEMEIFKIELAARLRSSMIKAFSKFAYDCIIINGQEALLTAESIRLSEFHPNVYYPTHSIADVGIFDNRFFQSAITSGILAKSKIKIIAQSDKTAELFLENMANTPERVSTVGLIVADRTMLDFNRNTDREGIVYIGPWEPRKDPGRFLDACKNTNNKAIIISPTKTSADKFKKQCLSLGIEHEIHIGLTGVNKVEVLKRAALAIIPSKEETFCFTALECAHLCRTIIPNDRAWSAIHKDWCILASDFEEAVHEHYGKPQTPEVEEALIKYDQACQERMIDIVKLTHNSSKKATQNALSKQLDQYGELSVEEFCRMRPSFALDELYYINRILADPNYEIKQSKDDTLIKLKGHSIVDSKELQNAFFNGGIVNGI
jgi:glycosyltransferase involved in cell wall biosynthesis